MHQLKGKNRSFTSSLKIKKPSNVAPLFSQFQPPAKNDSFFKLPTKSDMSTLIHKYNNNMTASPLFSMLKVDRSSHTLAHHKDDDLDESDIFPEKSVSAEQTTVRVSHRFSCIHFRRLLLH